jgi:hypothetical protein
MSTKHPFSITLFATTGEPEGIRYIDKSNWSGCGVVFTKNLVNTLKHEPGLNNAAIYILVGNAAEQTIYIGEADPVHKRLKTHVAEKEGWAWGVYFFDQNNKIGKTEVQYLEARLMALAKQCGRAIVTNKNNSTEPTMSPAAKASAQAFLADMLLILPMLGINAFTESRSEEASEQVQPVGTDSDAFDTIVIPARSEGFQKVFLGENAWYSIRINAKHIPKLKYIASYQVAPIAAITHIAEIASIELYGDAGKYKVIFKDPAKRIVDIPRSVDSDIIMQSARYALREKLLSAKNLDQVWA